jgi:putative membrane protein
LVEERGSLKTVFSARFHAYLRGLILIGFALLWLKLLLTDQILNYVSPRMLPLISLSTLLFLILGIIQIVRSTSDEETNYYCECGIDHQENSSFFKNIGLYSMMFFPLLIGFVFSNHIMDSSVVQNKGIHYSLVKQNNESNHNQSSSSSVNANRADVVENDNLNVSNDGAAGKGTIAVKDDQYTDTLSMIDENLDHLVGRKVEITGFVYRGEHFRPNQLVVARFVVSCCIADASVYGLLAERNDLAKYKKDTWVKVTGILSKEKYEGNILPMLKVEDIQVVPRPKNPYVYEKYNQLEP